MQQREPTAEWMRDLIDIAAIAAVLLAAALVVVLNP
jgi:hypothetical protein